MAAHAIAIDTLSHGPELRYRWHCSCGYRGEWKLGELSGARLARNGGTRHVAAMERGR